MERLWGTFQDRLVSELRLAGAGTIEEANKVLRDYLPNHNRKFAVPAQQPGSAFRGVPVNASDHFCFKYHRTVGLDNVIRIGPHRLQVLLPMVNVALPATGSKSARPSMALFRSSTRNVNSK